MRSCAASKDRYGFGTSGSFPAGGLDPAPCRNLYLERESEPPHLSRFQLVSRGLSFLRWAAHKVVPNREDPVNDAGNCVAHRTSRGVVRAFARGSWGVRESDFG